jgi:hypothetical protein
MVKMMVMKMMMMKPSTMMVVIVDGASWYLYDILCETTMYENPV